MEHAAMMFGRRFRGRRLVKGSPSYHDYVLRVWSKRSNLPIGSHGCAGFALFWDAGGYVIEHRGPGFHAIRFEFPVLGVLDFFGKPVERWLWRVHRREAFEAAVAVLRKLTAA